MQNQEKMDKTCTERALEGDSLEQAKAMIFEQVFELKKGIVSENQKKQPLALLKCQPYRNSLILLTFIALPCNVIYNAKM